jgi:Flp pilus assembly protein TadG
MRQRIRARKKGERGHSIMEFALVAIPTVMLLLGVVVIGIDLGRSVQVAQICRDAGSMYVRGVDFSQSGAQQMLARLGQAMNLQTSGGSGIVILSKIQFVPTDPTCTDTCAGAYRLAQRITIGNTSLTGFTGTHFPTAGAVSYDSEDNVVNYTTNANAVVSNFGSTLVLNPNEVSYVAEAYFVTSDTSLDAWQGAPGIYAQSFF